MFQFIKNYLIVILLIPLYGQSDVSLAPIFNDGAVLQCDMPVNIWGTAEPNEMVTVSFAGQKKTAVASDRGEWQVVLDPMQASKEPRSLIASIGNLQSSIDNVLVGEVWLAAGQSNMQMTLNTVDGGPERLARRFPNIHFAQIPQRTELPVQKSLTSADVQWKEFAPGQNRRVSAVAFFFAEKIQLETGRPVGIIQSSVGGTPCQAWMPLSAIEALPSVRYMADGVRAEQDKPFKKTTPSILFENMIRPLVPYTARGVIWYQGETGSSKPDEYRVLFPQLIHTWRAVWDRPELPFLFVQLAAYDSKHGDFAGQRAVQTWVRDTVPNTGMALAIDCGEKADIHPKRKAPVGERLARLALSQVYGRDVISLGPRFQALEKTDGRLRVVFQCSEKKKGGGSASFQCSENVPQASRLPFQTLETSDADVPGFEVAGAGGEFYPATATIVTSNTVELVCEAVEDPVSVRYAWHNWIEPPVTLENSAGLPAEPFVFNFDGTL